MEIVNLRDEVRVERETQNVKQKYENKPGKREKRDGELLSVYIKKGSVRDAPFIFPRLSSKWRRCGGSKMHWEKEDGEWGAGQAGV